MHIVQMYEVFDKSSTMHDDDDDKFNDLKRSRYIFMAFLVW